MKILYNWRQGFALIFSSTGKGMAGRLLRIKPQNRPTQCKTAYLHKEVSHASH